MLPIFFFFNDTATTEIYTLSLHDALPIFTISSEGRFVFRLPEHVDRLLGPEGPGSVRRRQGLDLEHNALFHIERSEEHTSELQSRLHLVCRLLLEKKKKKLSGYLQSRRHS